jgi:hypothetical protein
MVPTGSLVKETRMIGTVFVHRNDDWLEPEYENAIAVLAWMKDGEPMRIEVEAARVTNGPSWAYAAMFVRELAENERAGYPVLFLLKEGEFVAARSEFSDERLNAVLAAAHLGLNQDLSDALQRLESPNERSTETELSLLGMVAKTGRLELVETLLGSGAEIDSSAYKPHSAL